MNVIYMRQKSCCCVVTRWESRFEAAALIILAYLLLNRAIACILNSFIFNDLMLNANSTSLLAVKIHPQQLIQPESNDKCMLQTPKASILNHSMHE